MKQEVGLVKTRTYLQIFSSMAASYMHGKIPRPIVL